MYPADFQVAAVTSEVSPMTLLGLIQFKHAIVEEVTDSLDDEGDTSADGVDSAPEASEPVTTSIENNSSPPVEESVAEPPVDDSPRQQGAGGMTSNDDAIAAFVAAGLDSKTAEVLAIINHIASIEELTTLLADADFNLTDLDEVGAIRAEKIKTIFSAVSVN